MEDEPIKAKSKIAGSIKFIQNHKPPFDAGTYRLVLSQELSLTNKELLYKEIEFAVAGERFSFKPDEFGSCFPPADGVGAYDNVLPHIVLKRKTLPWERTATGASPKKADDGDIEPWLALLVFEEKNAPELKSVKVGDLFDAKDFDESKLPPDTFSAFSPRPSDYHPRDIHEELEYHESLSDPCKVIDIPLDIFNQVAPAQVDLHLLAHARQLNIPIPKKKGEKKTRTESTDFSVVFGNRLPAVGKRNITYLVSLQSIANYLPSLTGEEVEDTFDQRKNNDKEKIRLVVLRNWSFEVKPSREKNHQSFAQLVANLNGGDASMSLLRWSQESKNSEVKKAFELGFTALPHQTRLGDKTVSWYRGPFIPHKAEKTVSLPILGADAITFFNEKNGMFDLSYASAWQLGRLLALNSKGFATQIYNWKRSVRKQTSDKMVQKHLRAMSPQHESESEAGDKKNLVRKIIISSLHDILDKKKTDSIPFPNRSDRHAEKMEKVTDKDNLNEIFQDKPTVPESLSAWLGRLMLLHGVPFNYLVPDTKLLPVESIRFFQLDVNWMASLIDGANAIGRNGDSDAHDHVFAEHLFEQAWHSAGIHSPTEVSGFLLRSALVDGWWPGLKIDGYRVANDHPEDNQRLPILRLERLSSNVILCLFDGTVKRLDFHPPPEGLHFGLTILDRDDNGIPIKFEKELRNLDTGKEIMEDNKTGAIKAKALQDIPFRGERVLQIAALYDGLYHQLGKPSVFTSAEFAMQMIEGTQMGGFIHEE